MKVVVHISIHKHIQYVLTQGEVHPGLTSSEQVTLGLKKKNEQ